jgi:DNA-binding CsgD family transcriptional regulator
MFRKIVSYEVECDLCKNVWQQENEPATNVLIEEEEHLLCPECLIKLKNMFVTSMFPTGTTYQDVTDEPISEPKEEGTDEHHNYYVKEGALYVDNWVWDTPKIKKLIDLYNSGKTYYEMAAELKTTYKGANGMIARIRRAKPGWPLYQFQTALGPKRKHGPRKKSVTNEASINLNETQIEAICIMWSHHKSKDEIAETLAIKVSDVTDAINAVCAAKRGKSEYSQYKQFASLISEEE